MNKMPNAEAIHAALRDCLMSAAEAEAIPEADLAAMTKESAEAHALFKKYNLTPVNAVMINIALHTGRVEKYRQLVIDCINNVDPKFAKGYSFLALCEDREGRQWGEHRNADELIALAMALGMCKFCADRSLWSRMPGGVPYLYLNVPDDGKEVL